MLFLRLVQIKVLERKILLNTFLTFFNRCLSLPGCAISDDVLLVLAPALVRIKVKFQHSQVNKTGQN